MTRLSTDVIAMRDYDFNKNYNRLLTPDVVALLSAIHEYKGEQTRLEIKKDVLASLVEIAKIQSTEASNKIEGIYTSDERLKMIVREKTMPKTRNEKEIAGYRDVLSSIHENYEYIYPRPSYFLQMHRDMYRYSGVSIGGSYKNADNVIEETDENGNRFVRFRPVPAWETPEAVERLCTAYEEALRDPEHDPLLLIPMFILDFLCIHPFNDGNGRMSRLLTLLLLYRSGYTVGKYISIEKLIADSKESYYEALLESDSGWHEGENDYAPFVRYMLGIIAAAYREFSSRVLLVSKQGVSKPDRVREIIKNRLGRITKAEIMEQCPDIASVTVQRALTEMLNNGEIIKIGGGRYTSYAWNGDK